MNSRYRQDVGDAPVAKRGDRLGRQFRRLSEQEGLREGRGLPFGRESPRRGSRRQAAVAARWRRTRDAERAARPSTTSICSAPFWGSRGSGARTKGLDGRAPGSGSLSGPRSLTRSPNPARGAGSVSPATLTTIRPGSATAAPSRSASTTSRRAVQSDPLRAHQLTSRPRTSKTSPSADLRRSSAPSPGRRRAVRASGYSRRARTRRSAPRDPPGAGLAQAPSGDTARRSAGASPRAPATAEREGRRRGGSRPRRRAPRGRPEPAPAATRSASRPPFQLGERLHVVRSREEIEERERADAEARERERRGRARRSPDRTRRGRGSSARSWSACRTTGESPSRGGSAKTTSNGSRIRATCDSTSVATARPAPRQPLGTPRGEVRDEVGRGQGVRLDGLRLEARLQEGTRQEPGSGVEIERPARRPGGRPPREATARASLEERVEEEPVRLEERGDRHAEARSARLEVERRRSRARRRAAPPRRPGRRPAGRGGPRRSARARESAASNRSSPRSGVPALPSRVCSSHLGRARLGERLPHGGKPREERFGDDLARDEVRDLRRRPPDESERRRSRPSGAGFGAGSFAATERSGRPAPLRPGRGRCAGGRRGRALPSASRATRGAAPASRTRRRSRPAPAGRPPRRACGAVPARGRRRSRPGRAGDRRDAVDEEPVAGKAAGDERHGPVEPAEAASTRDDALDRQLARHRGQSPRRVSGVRPKAFRTARRLIAE